MSQENVALVRAATEAVKSPDGITALAQGDLDLTFVDPEVEWDATQSGDLVPDLADVYWGHEGVRTYWRRWLEAWRDIQFEIRDVLSSVKGVSESSIFACSNLARRASRL